MPEDPTHTTSPRIFDVVAVLFVAFLLISNIVATKITALDMGPVHLVFDGGAILFPLTYVLGDVLAEVYGFARARRVVVLGFAVSLLASLTFWLVQVAPVGPGYTNQAAYEAVLGFVPRIVAASVLGYLAGQLVNALVLVRIRRRWGPKHLWARLVGSTLVGEALDTLIFCTVAFIGVIPAGEFLNYVLTGYVYKVGVEVLLLPVTYRVIAGVRRVERLRHDEVLAA
ncbi:queuosine precursor transporter [Schaalia sp. 19OD2882]|uniref:queuosine precursor transporter n=1 Tax=Schaalia sp. 19OD2882 TaxID=2794089 RepID=UPI001C1EA232|nr:queuosine precursor transporter [Schaalia sp. 19OD2882]QWW18748.1 queuosine precursor transporter [Schaalia sp. 19OD2882]